MTKVEKSTLEIGWASINIIPDRPALLRGLAYARVGKEALDPITATALALESELGDRVIFVSADLCGIDEKTMARARMTMLELTPDFDPMFLVVNATHSHTSLSGLFGIYPKPNEDCMTPEETVDFMGDKIAEVASEAWRRRKRGSLSWGFGQAVVGHNRRSSYSSGESRMYGRTDDPEFSHIEGYEDHSVDALFTYDDNHRPTGVIVNLACPSQCSASLSKFSADFWHETRLEIRGRLGEDLFVLPQCSAAGDQSPSLLVHRAAESRMLALKEGVREKDLDFAMAQRREIARRISSAVQEVYPLASREIHDKVVFTHFVDVWDLPVQEIAESDREEAEVVVREAQETLDVLDSVSDWQGYSTVYRQRFRYQRVINRYDSQTENTSYPMETHIIRLGDIAFATNPFELFLDFGLRIKAASKAIQTFVVQLAGRGSYVPTARAVKGRGYGAEVASNPVGPEGGRLIVENSVKSINELFGEID